MVMIEDDLIAGPEGAPECPIRTRAMETIERVDGLLSEPRPFAEGAAEFEKLARERAEPFVQKRAPAAIVRKTRTPAPEPLAPAGDSVTTETLMLVLRGVIEREREATNARVATALAEANARVASAEARLASVEARLAGIESRKSKK
ncbi:MAG: hypothetical protein ACR65U_01790 [Methylocystis sp.]